MRLMNIQPATPQRKPNLVYAFLDAEEGTIPANVTARPLRDPLPLFRSGDEPKYFGRKRLVRFGVNAETSVALP